MGSIGRTDQRRGGKLKWRCRRREITQNSLPDPQPVLQRSIAPGDKLAKLRRAHQPPVLGHLKKDGKGLRRQPIDRRVVARHLCASNPHIRRRHRQKLAAVEGQQALGGKVLAEYWGHYHPAFPDGRARCLKGNPWKVSGVFKIEPQTLLVCLFKKAGWESRAPSGIGVCQDQHGGTVRRPADGLVR